MSINELEKAYQQLREQLLRSELDEEEFKSQVERLCFEDNLGHTWRIGWYTGKWYHYDQGKWVQDSPPEHLSASEGLAAAAGRPGAEDSRSRRPLALWLVAVLLALLVASAVLAIGGNLGW